MFILNRPNPVSKAIGGSIGLAKEYNADRKAKEQGEHDSSSDEKADNDHEWAQAIDETQQDVEQADKKVNDERSDDDLIRELVQKHPPPPPYSQQQPIGKLSMPVILPQRRPESRTRGFVRAYAPVLEDAGVSQQAWMEFLDGFERSIEKNWVFHALNLSVFVLDHAYIITTANIWAKPIFMAIHLGVETSRRAYIHGKQNTFLDKMNNEYFKPRGLFAMIVKYKPSDTNELAEYVDVRKNITESIERRDDPEREKWKNFLSSSSSTGGEKEMPEFAPLTFPNFDSTNESQREGATKHFRSFMQHYSDRSAQARFNAKNPDSKLANVAPQHEYASRYSNPNHPARQGGLVSLVTGGKVNPKSRVQRHREYRHEARGDFSDAERLEAANRNAEDNNLSLRSSNTAERVPSNVSDGRNEVAWQATRQRQGGPMRRLLRQDVLYLLVVNMPSEQELEGVRKQAGL